MNDGTTVATIADMNNLIFKGNVDETEVGLLRVGMPMSIAIGAMPELAPSATIEYISPKGNDSGGANTFEIKAALCLDSSEGLRAGYSAKRYRHTRQSRECTHRARERCHICRRQHIRVSPHRHRARTRVLAHCRNHRSQRRIKMK